MTIVTLTLVNSSGCELDNAEVTVKGGEVRLDDVALATDWKLSPGDTIRVDFEEVG